MNKEFDEVNKKIQEMADADAAFQEEQRKKAEARELVRDKKLINELEDWFTKPINDLPKEKQEFLRVKDILLYALWDETSPEDRQKAAADSDYQNNKAMRQAEINKAYSNKDELLFLFSFYGIRNSWGYWAGKPQLMAKEAIPLMCGMPPEVWREEHQTKLVDPEWDNWIKLIERELEISKLDGSYQQLKSPSEWLEWGRANGLDKPLLKSTSDLDEPDICLCPPFASAVENLTTPQDNNKSSKTTATDVTEQEKVPVDELQAVTRTTQSNDFYPNDDIGRIMKTIAQLYVNKGCVVNGEEMLSGLRKQLNATIKKSDDDYVSFTNPRTNNRIKLSKSAYEKRLTRIRKWSKANQK